MNHDKLKAWLCFKHAPGLSLRNSLELLRIYPEPGEFIGNPGHELYSSERLSPATAEHLKNAVLPERMDNILQLCKSQEISYLCYTDADFPTALQGILAPPLILYYKGDLHAALQGFCLAVVGTRKPSAYGVEMCRRLLAPVCGQGVCIVSGLAMGIDTIAHQTALSSKSNTIAVLAHGLDIVYPPGNKTLAEKIAHYGAVVSEYDPGTKPDRWNFSDRNRIISALSQAVLIVEAPFDSGALLTANFARQQARPVYALPGNINHQNAEGPNKLIREGACIITSPEDLMSDLGLNRSTEEQLILLPELNEDEQKLYDIVTEKNSEISFDELLLHTGLSFGKLSTILLNLELKGMLAKSSGNSFIRV